MYFLIERAVLQKQHRLFVAQPHFPRNALARDPVFALHVGQEQISGSTSQGGASAYVTQLSDRSGLDVQHVTIIIVDRAKRDRLCKEGPVNGITVSLAILIVNMQAK